MAFRVATHAPPVVTYAIIRLDPTNPSATPCDGHRDFDDQDVFHRMLPSFKTLSVSSSAEQVRKGRNDACDGPHWFHDQRRRLAVSSSGAVHDFIGYFNNTNDSVAMVSFAIPGVVSNGTLILTCHDDGRLLKRRSRHANNQHQYSVETHCPMARFKWQHSPRMRTPSRERRPCGGLLHRWKRKHHPGHVGLRIWLRMSSATWNFGGWTPTTKLVS